MFKRLKPWLILLAVTDIFFIFLLWVVSAEHIHKIILIMLLFTFLTILLGYYLEWKQQQNKIKLVKEYLDTTNDITVENLLQTVDLSWHTVILDEAVQRKEIRQRLEDKTLEQQSYQEFIEEWIHEIKTPLALALMVLDNHKEEMSPYVYKRMEHVRHSIYANVERILYYARLHTAHADYHFERFFLKELIIEKLDDFKAVYNEKQIELQLNLTSFLIMSDRKVLAFILSQLFSNAFKYAASDHGIVRVECWADKETGDQYLAIRNNGTKVLSEDIPFLFDKGFTGSQPKRQNATGMGLYFAKKYAEALSLKIEIENVSSSIQEFGIMITFPFNESE